MKKLEEIIRRNIEKFNTGEPSLGHIDKFRNKLDKYHAKRRHGGLYKIYGYAASIAAIFILVLFIVQTLISSDKQEKLPSTATKELIEVESYYMSEIETNYKVLNEGLNKCPKQKKEASSCFRELDESFKNLQEDLKENPSDERIINAVIKHYQVKLEIIDQIIKQTEEHCI